MKLSNLLEVEYGVHDLLKQHMDQIKLDSGPNTYRMLQTQLTLGKDAWVEGWLIKNGYMEDKSSPFEEQIINEFVGEPMESRVGVLFDKLVPGQGQADTVEGEMLRAINRIVYRYYNDGDEYMRGYGTETAGPAHAFLVDSNNPKKSALNQIFSTGTNYETTIKDALELIVDYIESRNGEYTKNNLGDMLSYDAHFEDEEDYDDDYDDYDDEDYQQEQIQQLREAIKREILGRKNGVYFVTPRKKDIPFLEKFMKENLPSIKYVVAHGQLAPKILEERISKFYNQKVPLMISTNNVENGLDLPHVNTIIIYRSNLFSLSGIYQLKGRVGRSSKRGYAYLTYNEREMTDNGRKRLKVINSFDQLGSGFNIASQDFIF